MEQTLLDIASNTWGPHPLDWPSPPPKRPPFWHIQTVKRLKALEEVFGHLSNEALQRYWQEVSKGQSVYEDCGGYLLRCYKAMLNEDVEEPVSVTDTLEALLREAAEIDRAVDDTEGGINSGARKNGVRFRL